MKEKKKKIWFIVLVSIFATLWVASLVFLAISTLNYDITEKIQTAYANKFEDKTLNLFKLSFYSTIITTAGLLITLLFKELRKKYLK